MEMLNRIELRGFVGKADTQNVGDMEHTRFSLRTEYAFQSADGAMVECTWFNCSAWSDKCPTAKDLKGGEFVDLTGRVRSFRFTTESGSHCGWEIIVRSLEIIAK